MPDTDGVLASIEPDPPPEETPTTARCRCCRRPLKADTSLGYRIGPDCRKRLGLVPRRPVRVTGVPAWRDCDGQTDLLEET